MRYRTLAVAAAITVALGGCAGGQDPTIGDRPLGTTDAPDGTETGTTPTAGDGTEVATEAVIERIEITVSGGEVEGSATVSLEAGTQVELVVTSDVADEIHVHGYDLHQDLAAGETAIVAFTADIPGVFEVELEERKTHLVELQISG